MAFFATVAATLQRQRPNTSWKWRQRIPLLITHILLIAGGLMWVYPFAWALGSSLKTNAGFFNDGLSVFPSEVQWSNYEQAWNKANFGTYFFNTIFVTLATVFFVLIFTSMSGYVLARKKFPGKKIIIGIVVASMFLPTGYTIIPVFDIIQRLGLLDTLWSIILVQVAGGMVFNTFLFMGYFSTMSQELEDAARVDGGNFHQVFWQVMFPLAGPMLATVALFTFINTWNSFFVPVVFTIGSPELRTLAVGMYAFIGQNTVNWNLLCAGSVITLVPIMLVFAFLQRFFINGVAGAIKA